ncbi:hypothetical protein BDD12DRAFT_888700 [Trichophaea hybrida]|nr:hypothetical protein BDD12DRAFT_888700 [Trichophaea hybrida]
MRKEKEADRRIQEMKRQVLESTLRGSQASVRSSVPDSSQSKEASESWPTAADGGLPSKQLPSPVPTTQPTTRSSIRLNFLEGYEENVQDPQSSRKRKESEAEENLPKAKKGRTPLRLDGFEDPLVREVVQKGSREMARWALMVEPPPLPIVMCSQLQRMWEKVKREVRAERLPTVPPKQEWDYIHRGHTNARSGLVHKIKCNVLKYYKLRDLMSNEMKLAREVSALLRDDNFIFLAEDRDPKAANEIAYALYDQFWATNTSANFRLESPEDIRAELVCLTATCIEWFLGGWTSGKYVDRGQFEEKTVGSTCVSQSTLANPLIRPSDMYNRHLELWNLNYEEEEASDVFPNRLANIARLKEQVMTDRQRVQKEEERRLNEESSGSDDDDD